MRIVSLVPSLTETIVDLGLKDQLVGITSFCVDPPGLHKHAQIIGGTKNPDLNMIAALDPTRVIVNEEENRSADIQVIRANYNMLSTFPKGPFDVPKMLHDLGDFLGVQASAREESALLDNELAELKSLPPIFGDIGRTFAYLIWRDPWMAVSRDTYISRFLRTLGLENVIRTDVRYPEVEPLDVVALRPDVIFMSSEPWPFRKRDADAWRNLTPANSPPIMWIDGKSLSWYGSSTRKALQKVRSLSDLIRTL